MKKTINILFFLALFSTPAFAQGMSAMGFPPALKAVQEAVQSILDGMDKDLGIAARALSKGGVKGEDTRSILLALCEKHPNAVDACTVDMRGRMVVVEPQAFKMHEGADISDQEQVIRVGKTKRPVFSHSFRAVEGFDAVDLQHPIFSPGGKMIGSVSLLIRPVTLLGDQIRPRGKDHAIDVWAMETGGRILYDSDVEEIGRNLFQDPVYQSFPELLALGKTIAKERTGKGIYDFLGPGLKEAIKKRASWATVGLHGTEWRLVSIQQVPGVP